MNRPRLALALFVTAAVLFAVALLSAVGDDFQVVESTWLTAGFLATALAHVAERWPS